MAVTLSVADRVAETATNAGLSPFVLNGAVDNRHVTFETGVGNSILTPYTAVHRISGQWEIGYGVTSVGGLTRVAVIMNSSQSTSLINFSAGLVDVFLDMPGELLTRLDDGPLQLDASGVDTPAAQRTIRAPRSTGAATPAPIIFQVGHVQSSGSTVQPWTTILTLSDGSMVLAAGAAFTLTGTTVLGAPTWGSGQAITLTTAAQPNITSLGTLAADLLFGDNTYDIGKSGATRPRNIFAGGTGTFGGGMTIGSDTTIGGNLAVGSSTRASTTSIILNTAAANIRQLNFQTAGVDRWYWRVDSTAETGGDAGSNAQFIARHDDGTIIGNAMAFTRATMAVSFNGLATAVAGFTVSSGQTLTLTGATVAGAPAWSSNQAITLSTAAQPNVTSLGTLTALTMGGTLTVGAHTLALASATISGQPTWSSSQTLPGLIVGSDPGGGQLVRIGGTLHASGAITADAGATIAGAFTINFDTLHQFSMPGDQSIFQTYNSAGSAGPRYVFRTARGNVASPTATQNSDLLGQITFSGYDGSGYNGQASIFAQAAQTFASGTTGTQIVFRTTPNGSGTMATALTLGQDQSTTFAGLATGAFNGRFGPNFTVGNSGAAILSQTALRVASTITASSATAVGVNCTPLLQAAANGDTLQGIVAAATYTPGAFTGVSAWNLNLGGIDVSAFTSPGDPVSIHFNSINGTGATNASQIVFGTVTGATNNYLLRASTVSTFNVTAAGLLTSTGLIVGSDPGGAQLVRVGGSVVASGLITASAGATIASGQTLTVTGATIAGAPTVSGIFAFTNASPFSIANGQTLTLSTTAQTVGAATLTIPNFAHVNDTFAFVTLAQTLANKTLTAPVVSGTITLNTVAYTWPSSAGTNLFFLQTDGVGTLSWAAAPAAAAGSLTGTTLASNVVSSSLTSVGTLTSLSVSGNITLTTNASFLRGTTTTPTTVNLISVPSGNTTQIRAAVDASGVEWTNQAGTNQWMVLNNGTRLKVWTAGSATAGGGIQIGVDSSSNPSVFNNDPYNNQFGQGSINFYPVTISGGHGAGAKIMLSYWSGSTLTTALSVANVSSGAGTLSLMPGGGAVQVGGSTVSLAATSTAITLTGSTITTALSLNSGTGTAELQGLVVLNNGGVARMILDSSVGTFSGTAYATVIASDVTPLILMTNAAVGLVVKSTVVQMPQYGAGTATFDASGNISSVSDTRHKTDITAFTRGMADLRQIKPITYRYNAKSGMETENFYSGFSAQNVREFIPEAVFERGDGLLSFADRPVLAAVVNAVQELDQRVERLERLAKIAA